MKLNELKNYTDNNNDKNIIDKMTIDKESTLNSFVANVISDLLKGIPIDEEYKLKAKNNIENYDSKSIGEIGMYVSLIPYLQLELKDNKDGYVIITSFIEMLISYIVGYISRKEFIVYIMKMKHILNISDKLYEGMNKYFAKNKNQIVDEIIKNTYGN